MNEALKSVPTPSPITHDLADWISTSSPDDITPAARRRARHALLDWFGCTIAGAEEPLVDILIDELDVDNGSTGDCSIVGRNLRSGRLDAALINGAASHALDYDDVHKRIHGHPTVVVAPAALALAECMNLKMQDVITGIVTGTEAACLIGQMAGHDHYSLGYHATGTMGTFGAAATATKLMQLDVGQTRHALGIAASQASGLKANFGTMTKPFHAGKAAMHGVLSARLAAKGFTANENVLEARVGTAEVMMPGFVAGHTQPNPAGFFAIEQNLFKYHAACYLTHASIEAIQKIRAEHNIGLSDLKRMTLKVDEGHFSVCNIPEPTTGLEIKFSIRQCAVLALAGVDTAALETYCDENALNPEFAAARALTHVEAIEIDDNMAADVIIELKDGRTFSGSHNAGIAATDIEAQETKLVSKFHALSVPRIGEAASQQLAGLITDTDNNVDVASLMKLSVRN